MLYILIALLLSYFLCIDLCFFLIPLLYYWIIICIACSNSPATSPTVSHNSNSPSPTPVVPTTGYNHKIIAGIPCVAAASKYTAPVHIDVGGTIYTSSLDTLTKLV